LTWLVYLLECSDGTYYAGITNRLEHRLEAHNSGQGARYTRSRRPVALLATQEHPDRSEASKAEIRLKQLPRSEKLAFFGSINASIKTKTTPEGGYFAI
jgi:putative endonuclease